MGESETSAEVRFRFVGAGLWDGGDAFPYPVPVARVPVVGEFVTLPDDLGWWEVVQVEHDYSRGLHYPPVVGVVCCRPSEKRAWLEAQGR
jgi:hypothetical protein